MKQQNSLKRRGFVKDVDNRFSPHFAYNRDGQFSGPSWDTEYNAPTLQMAMKWLREKYGLHIYIFVTYKDGAPHYQWSIDNLKTQDTISETPCCNAYEEACEAAIKYCLENLI